jgi:hypothetical protein
MAKHARRPSIGRHRLGNAALVHCRAHFPVDTRPDRFALRRWFSRSARHSFVALTRQGARPRPVLAILAAL